MSGSVSDDLGRRVAAAGVGDALVAAEYVRAIDEAFDTIQFGSVGVIPRVGNVLKDFVHLNTNRMLIEIKICQLIRLAVVRT